MKSASGLGATALAALFLLAFSAVPAQTSAPDYALWDEVLLHNVRDGYVDYDGIRANPKFELFIGQLAGKPPPFASKAEELAYYINAYNALAARGILDGYSPATRFGRFRYFKRLKFTLGGERLSLDDIEHRRLRLMGDARIHFAIVCASISCPRLSNRAYLPETVELQLDDAARRFVNDITRNRFDVALKTAFLSPIFDWFRADFERAAGSVPQYLAPFIEEPAARAALLEGRLAIRYLPYDWELNGHLARE